MKQVLVGRLVDFVFFGFACYSRLSWQILSFFLPVSRVSIFILFMFDGSIFNKSIKEIKDFLFLKKMGLF